MHEKSYQYTMDENFEMYNLSIIKYCVDGSSCIFSNKPSSVAWVY